MKRLDEYPASAALLDFIHEICPIDAHMNVTMQGVWGLGHDGFSNQPYSTITTSCVIVRAMSCKGITYWTRESWTHNNGYQCKLDKLTKEQFQQCLLVL